MTRVEADIAKFLEGDPQFVKNLVAELQVAVRRQHNLSIDDVKDIAQEAQVRALENIHRFDRRSPFTTWVKGIALNVAKEYWRSPKRREISVDPAEAQEISEEVAFDAQLVVDDFMSGMSSEEQTIMEMTQEGYSAADMGQALGKSAQAIRSKKSRLLKKLRESWREMED